MVTESTCHSGVSLGSSGRRLIQEAVNIRLFRKIYREPRRLSTLVRADFSVLLFHDPLFFVIQTESILDAS